MLGGGGGGKGGGGGGGKGEAPPTPLPPPVSDKKKKVNCKVLNYLCCAKEFFSLTENMYVSLLPAYFLSCQIFFVSNGEKAYSICVV